VADSFPVATRSRLTYLFLRTFASFCNILFYFTCESGFTTTDSIVIEISHFVNNSRSLTNGRTDPIDRNNGHGTRPVKIEIGRVRCRTTRYNNNGDETASFRHRTLHFEVVRLGSPCSPHRALLLMCCTRALISQDYWGDIKQTGGLGTEVPQMVPGAELR